MVNLLLSTSSHSFQKIGLEASVSLFQLPHFFGATDQEKGPFISLSLDFFLAPTPYDMIEICILDGSVMQKIVPMIPGCV